MCRDVGPRSCKGPEEQCAWTPQPGAVLAEVVTGGGTEGLSRTDAWGPGRSPVLGRCNKRIRTENKRISRPEVHFAEYRCILPAEPSLGRAPVPGSSGRDSRRNAGPLCAGK